jgi:hypothetical protein
MRMMMKVSIPVEAGNAAAIEGKLGSTIQKILTDMKPEAAYFVEENGLRTGIIIFQMTDQSEIPKFAEPWFIALNASLTIKPAMTIEDLGKAAPAMEAAAKAYA